MIIVGYGAAGTTTALISDIATLMPVDAVFAGVLASQLGVGDWTYLRLYNAGDVEVVKATDITGLIVTIERDIAGNGPHAFPSGTSVCFDMPAQAVQDILTAAGLSANIGIAGTGLAEVTEPSPDNFVVNVPEPNFSSASDELVILGSWPNISFAFEFSGGCVGGSSAASSSISLTGTGLAAVSSVGPSAYQVNVPAPAFTGSGVTISGTWPNIDFAVTGSGGTVISVGAGAGLTLTGSAVYNPTLNITNTGVVAGTYGGVGINARGQITVVPVTFNPVSSIVVTAGTGLSVSRAADEVTLAGIPAEVGVVGTVALADDAAPLDPSDDTTAVTPALLAIALSEALGAEVAGGQTYNGEIDALYTNIVPTTVVSLDLAAGETALVIVQLTVHNEGYPMDIPEYGLALFDGTPARLQANAILSQQQQLLVATIAGPYTNTLAVVTTDITGYTVASKSIHAIIL